MDTEAFRDQVLEQRDRIADSDATKVAPHSTDASMAGTEQAMLHALGEIRDILQRIEARLK